MSDSVMGCLARVKETAAVEGWRLVWSAASGRGMRVRLGPYVAEADSASAALVDIAHQIEAA